MHVEVRHLGGTGPLEHAPSLRVRLGGASPIRADRRPGGRWVLQRPRGQRGAGGGTGSCLEETPAVHFPARTGLFHVAILPVVSARLPYARDRTVVNSHDVMGRLL